MNNSGSPEFNIAWVAAFEIDELKKKITELEAVKPKTLTQIEARDTRIAKIRKKIAQLNAVPSTLRAKPGRKHVLDSIINKAIQTIGSHDIDLVWRELCRIAQFHHPIDPVVGYADQAIQYRDITGEDPSELHYYKRKNLSDKLGRHKRQNSAK